MFAVIIFLTMTYIGFLVRKEDISYWSHIKEGWRFALEWAISFMILTVILILVSVAFTSSITWSGWLPPIVSLIWCAMRSSKRDMLREGLQVLNNTYYTHKKEYQYGIEDEMDFEQFKPYITHKTDKIKHLLEHKEYDGTLYWENGVVSQRKGL